MEDTPENENQDVIVEIEYKDPDTDIYYWLCENSSEDGEGDSNRTPPVEQPDTHDVEIMTYVKMWVDKLPVECQNDDFKLINELVQSYLKTYCVHDVIQDEIDINPDESQTIFYCSKCFCTM